MKTEWGREALQQANLTFDSQESAFFSVYKAYQDQKILWLIQPNIKLLNSREGELVFATIKKSAREPASKAPIKLWHKRLGHIGIERIVKLSEMTGDITIESNPSKKRVGMRGLSIGRQML